MPNPLLLIIEDDELVIQSLGLFFTNKDYSVMQSRTGAEGLSAALKEIPDIVILDLRLPDMSGLEVLKEIKESFPEISVIMMTGYGEVKEAVSAMKLGAEYFFQKPIDLDELSVMVEKSLGIQKIRQESVLYKKSPFHIAGKSKEIQGLIHITNLLAANPSTTVLIQGETGTGKELVARNIHALSARKDKPFIDINCASLPENIVESELFGYEAGAFTDAKKTKKGLFELADGGTLFLDEIGDMPRNVQAKLLRVIETNTLKRLGGTRDIHVDVRIITATNRVLDDLVKKGAFREDLYYRLNVMPLTVPPLRERPEDIPLIADFLLQELQKTMVTKNRGQLKSDAIDVLSSYDWPGNVRELRNIIERALILSPDGNISSAHVMLPGRQTPEKNIMTLKDMEKTHIENALRLTDGNRTQAAQLLGIARSTLNEKLKLYKIG